ncbi:MAG: DUF3732 domain-containing protein [Ignavibacteriales bacterium]
MQTKIRKIILWPRNPEFNRREIEFAERGISVITGWSLTGKSALIPIIDYCLGSGRCSIPVGVIRQAVSWYGLLLEVDEIPVLCARREPGDHDSSGDMMLIEGKDVEIPVEPRANCPVEAAKERFSQLAGLPALDLAKDENKRGFEDRPSFRDMMAFVFQPQHVVANPYTLFYKADSYEHREKLRAVFPLVLGAISPEHLALRKQLSVLEKDLESKRRELENVKRAADVWLSNLRAHYSEARELGLLPPGAPPTCKSSHEFINMLSEVLSRHEANSPRTLSTEKTSNAVEEIMELHQEEYDIAERVAALRHRLAAFEAIASTTRQFSSALATQTGRLSEVGWLKKRIEKNPRTCPICGGAFTRALEELGMMAKAIEMISAESEIAAQVEPMYDKETEEVRKELRILEERLNVIRHHRRSLEEESEESRRLRQTEENAYRFIGRLEQSLRNFDLSRDDQGLAREIKDLEDKALSLRKILDPGQQKQRLKSAIERITVFAYPYLEALGVEKPEDPMILDPNNLSIRVDVGAARTPFLWEIGSGVNWLGYHIACLLALHEFLLGMDRSPVPSVLVLDQPSQVFFPDKWPTDPRFKGRKQDLETRSSGKVQDLAEWADDIRGVHRVFEALDMAVKKTGQKLQVIVIDHADEITWFGLESVSVVARWRSQDEKLIPSSWIRHLSND